MTVLDDVWCCDEEEYHRTVDLASPLGLGHPRLLLTYRCTAAAYADELYMYVRDAC